MVKSYFTIIALVALCLLAVGLSQSACSSGEHHEQLPGETVQPPTAELEETRSDERYAEGRLAIGYAQPNQVFVIAANTVLHQKGDIAVVGNGTLLVDGGKLHLTGTPLCGRQRDSYC